MVSFWTWCMLLTHYVHGDSSDATFFFFACDISRGLMDDVRGHDEEGA